MKYVSENSFEQINLEGFHIDGVKIINNQLHLRYEYIEILPENPQNPFDSIHCTNEAKLILYDFEVKNSGYYDCSNVKKQQYLIEEECTFIPINICNLLNDFTTVSVYKRDEPFEYYFAGFAHNFNGNWGCTICFKKNGSSLGFILLISVYEIINLLINMHYSNVRIQISALNYWF